MDFLQNIFQSAASYMVPFIILLGLLIFVHELGHFLVAKFFKVKIEVFSLGFGKRLFTLKRGGTDYCVSIIPLGGFVKMYGEQPGVEIPDELKEQSFSHKPVGQRIAIALAGPLMNLLFAFILFVMIAKIGETVLKPQLGDIMPNSVAYAQGFRSGDEILSINGEPVVRWDEVKEHLHPFNGKADIELKRIGSASNISIVASTQPIDSREPLESDKKVYWIPGLGTDSRPPLIGIGSSDSLAAQFGLKTGDLITHINDEPVKYWRDFKAQILSAEVETLKFKFLRRDNLSNVEEEGKEKELTFKIYPEASSLKLYGLYPSDTFIFNVVEDSPADKAGFKKGDRIISVNGTLVSHFEELIKAVNSYDGKPLQVELSRDGEKSEIFVTPELSNPDEKMGVTKKRYVMGVQPIAGGAASATFKWAISHPGQLLQRGFSQTLKWTKLTFLGLWKMIAGEVSSKNIGSFISIGQMAKTTWSIGMDQFLRIMAIISINLFIINLFPIPILDGGHIMFFTIEALRGAPLTTKSLEKAQLIGFVLLLILMSYALFNDVGRIFNF